MAAIWSFLFPAPHPKGALFIRFPVAPPYSFCSFGLEKNNKSHIGGQFASSGMAIR
ncbi:hypothetical protein [Gorillibacterium sp. sgz500922]|uniref:hypothetical protein n=1 Tax=Gorillibacterium sp. sgz500922 TaxID=3446694 RepID=UPI003F666255